MFPGLPLTRAIVSSRTARAASCTALAGPRSSSPVCMTGESGGLVQYGLLHAGTFERADGSPGLEEHAQHRAISAQFLPRPDTLATAQHAVPSGIAPDSISHFMAAVGEFSVVCAERTKVLQAQTDELEVSAGQLSACVAQGRAAAAQATTTNSIPAGRKRIFKGFNNPVCRECSGSFPYP